MFGLGFGEIVVILMVALLVLGPTKLPKLARQLGRGMREFRRAASEFQATLSEADVDRPAPPKPKIPTASPTDTVSSSNSTKSIPEASTKPESGDEPPSSQSETES